MFRTPSSRLRKGTDREKPSVRMVWGARDSGEVPERQRPPLHNGQVTVNLEVFHEALEPPNREGRNLLRPPTNNPKGTRT